jgi:Domain of unknown function (DUF5666)
MMMTKICRRLIGASGFALLFAMSFAAAQAPDMVRVRATIESVNGQTLNVKSRDGAALVIKLADKAPVRTAVKASLSDIKQGDYVAVTGLPQPDGTQKAVSIAIFPEALRGLGEGYRPWDWVPNSKMTNATVDSTVAGVDGQVLTLKYKEGEQKVVVTPTTEITKLVAGSMADVKAGEKIFIAATKKLPDGTLEASNITVGDYGVWR